MTTQVTIEKFAADIGISLEKLKAQLKGAGLPDMAADQTITEAEKRQLLEHLQARHGQTKGSEVVLKRKKMSEVSGVKVVVRKQRKVRRRTTQEIDQAKQAALEEEKRLLEEAEKERLALEAAELEAKKAKEEALAKEQAEKAKKEAELADAEVVVDASKDDGKDRKRKKEIDDEKEDRPLKKASSKKSKDLTEKCNCPPGMPIS